MMKDLFGLRQSLAAPISEGWTWCVLEEDGLLGRSRHCPFVTVLINRSRRNRLKWKGEFSNTLWVAGSFDEDEQVLGPQSAVVLSSVPGEEMEALVET